MVTFRQRAVRIAATGLGSGLVPWAPGTAGTLAALPLYFIFAGLTAPAYLGGLLFFTAAAVFLAREAEASYAVKDPPAIVIDEMAGFLWTMFAVPPTAAGILAGFILFRCFDIVKPFPIRLLEEKLPGGYGIVGDDIMAGVYSNLVLHVLLQFSVL